MKQTIFDLTLSEIIRTNFDFISQKIAAAATTTITATPMAKQKAKKKWFVCNRVSLAVKRPIGVNYVDTQISNQFANDVFFPLSFVRWSTFSHSFNYSMNKYYAMIILVCRMTYVEISTKRERKKQINKKFMIFLSLVFPYVTDYKLSFHRILTYAIDFLNIIMIDPLNGAM